MELEQEFLQLSTKFLFLNYGSQLPDYRNEINTLLNELNGLNYRAARISDVRSAVRLVESFVHIPPAEDTLVVKACFLLNSLVGRQSVLLPANVAQSVLNWLIQCLERCFYQVAAEVLSTMHLLFRQCNNISQFYEYFISDNGILINILADPNYRRVERRQQSSDHSDQCNTSELYSAAVRTIESILLCSEAAGDAIEPHLALVGNAVLDLIFKVRPDSFNEPTFYGLVTSALNSFRMVVELDGTGEWTNCQLGRLIGTGKAFMMFGIPDVGRLLPQRIPVSQQGIPEPQHIPMSKGGRVAKKRKSRPHPRGKKASAETRGSGGGDKKMLPTAPNNRLPYSESSIVLEWVSVAKPSTVCYRTSDSDYSENEATASSRDQFERPRAAKLRQAALILLGTLAQHVEKRIMFGYWHALFPDENRTQASVSLLNCVLRDPSPKCRIAAIQTTSFLLHKSKPFLIQAESSDKPLVSFTPFSVTLGNMILEMYAMLTQALAVESDLTVLTQLLKALAVFIQSTPFHRLRPGIATRFVRIVRPLVNHRDSTIKVAALMVMGFLISVPNMTEEIASLVGIRRMAQAPTGKEARSKPIMKALTLQVDQDEEEEEQEEEACDSETDAIKAQTDDCKMQPRSVGVVDGSSANTMSWLLQVALENLGVCGVACPIMSVRMECLQVLCVMTSHYSLLGEHLPLVARALVHAFGDTVAEIKLHAARVLDLLGHAIHTSLLLKDSVDPGELSMALSFWTALLPTVTDQIQDVGGLAATVRSVCCDALGNIGVNVFETLPRDRQLALVSLLTGCTFDEDSAVSSAAARALSVYILFPSLRDDVCYVENTVEAILRLLQDPSVPVRIKTSWSLGNVIDSLVINHHHNNAAHQEPSGGEYRFKIGDALLRRILEAALESSKDNDNVRSNAVRTIGNVLHLLHGPQLLLEEQEQGQSSGWATLWHAAIERLVENVSNANGSIIAKVKWNACYALGSMMKNEAIFSMPTATVAAWQRQVFPALCEVVVHSPNFKVRINAAQALTVISRRAHYGGNFFHTIWAALLQALEQSDNLVDYLEYKRRDTLQEQLCLSLAHCLRLATREDIGAMGAALLPLYDAVHGNWGRVINRILPEKSAVLLESYHQLLQLQQGHEGGGRRAGELDTVPPDSSWSLLLKCFECGDHAIREQ